MKLTGILIQQKGPEQSIRETHSRVYTRDESQKGAAIRETQWSYFDQNRAKISGGSFISLQPKLGHDPLRFGRNLVHM